MRMTCLSQVPSTEQFLNIRLLEHFLNWASIACEFWLDVMYLLYCFLRLNTGMMYCIVMEMVD